MAATTEQYTKAERYLKESTVIELIAIAESWNIDTKPRQTRKVTRQCDKARLIARLVEHEVAQRQGDLDVTYYRQFLEQKTLRELQLICKYEVKISTTYEDYALVKKLAQKSYLVEQILWYTEFATNF
jgi:hypothetical protein